MNPQDFVVEHNIRANIDTDGPEFKEFLASVEENGIVIPITYYVNGDGQKVVETGHRRLVAAQIAKISDIPAFRVSKAETENERIRRQLLENMHREDLNPIDTAHALAELAKTATQDDIANWLGKSAPWVSQHLKLLTLAEPLKERVQSGALGYRAAYEAASIPQGDQAEYADSIASAKTVRGVRQVKRSLAEIAKASTPKQLVDATLNELGISFEPAPDEEYLKVMRLIEMARDYVVQAKDMAHEYGMDISEPLKKLRKEI